MPERMRSVRRFSRVLALLAAGLALVATPNSSVFVSALAKPPPNCDTQVNDTPSKLVACIRTDDLMGYMKDLQAIADANPSPADGMPSRNSGEPGYKASVDYVASLMEDAGYNVTLQPYKFTSTLPVMNLRIQAIVNPPSGTG